MLKPADHTLIILVTSALVIFTLGLLTGYFLPHTPPPPIDSTSPTLSTATPIPHIPSRDPSPALRRSLRGPLLLDHAEPSSSPRMELSPPLNEVPTPPRAQDRSSPSPPRSRPQRGTPVIPRPLPVPNDHTIHLTRPVFTELLTAYPLLLTEIQLVNGTAVDQTPGLGIMHLDPTSRWGTILHLQEGDLLVSLNGIALTNPNATQAFLDQKDTLRTVALRLYRQNTPITITYNLEDPPLSAP